MNKSFIFFLLLFCTFSTNSLGQWNLKYYVDDFGDKTNEPYISFTDYNGTFSNSATSNSRLIVNLIVTIEEEGYPRFRFDLYEYGRGPSVGKQIGENNYTLKIKFSNGSWEEYSLGSSRNSLHMIYESEDGVPQSESFLHHLKKESSPIKCFLEINGEYSNQSYLFKINPIGFTNTYQKLLKSKSN